MAEYSKFQQNAIRNYYDNRESLAWQRVQELITELYLSEGAKRAKYWKSLAGHLKKIGVAQTTIDHLIEKDDPARVATLLQKMEK